MHNKYSRHLNYYFEQSVHWTLKKKFCAISAGCTPWHLANGKPFWNFSKDSSVICLISLAWVCQNEYHLCLVSTFSESARSTGNHNIKATSMPDTSFLTGPSTATFIDLDGGQSGGGHDFHAKVF